LKVRKCLLRFKTRLSLLKGVGRVFCVNDIKYWKFSFYSNNLSPMLQECTKKPNIG
jgi:hypothetical protein